MSVAVDLLSSYYGRRERMRSEAFSAIISVAAWMFAETMAGMIETLAGTRKLYVRCVVQSVPW